MFRLPLRLQNGPITPADNPEAPGPNSSDSASPKFPLDTPSKYSVGSAASNERVRRANRGKIAEQNRIRALLRATPVSNLRPTHRNRSDPGQDLPLRPMPRDAPGADDRSRSDDPHRPKAAPPPPPPRHASPAAGPPLAEPPSAGPQLPLLREGKQRYSPSWRITPPWRCGRLVTPTIRHPLLPPSPTFGHSSPARPGIPGIRDRIARPWRPNAVKPHQSPDPILAALRRRRHRGRP